MATQVFMHATNTRKVVACHVCASEEHATYLRARGYCIAQCRSCGFWYVNPQPTPEELNQFYASYDDGEQWRKGEEHFNRAVRKAILRIKRSGVALDIGCGSGNFLRCMREAGFSVFGIEPSESGSEYAREAHGIEIHHGMIEDYLAAHAVQRFDVITMLNVLEHLMDPARTLLQLRQALAPNGVLAIVVPDARFHDLLGRLRRSAGFPDPYWLERPNSFLSGFKLPDHLCSFHPETITSLLRRCGLRVVRIENAPIVFNPSFPRNFAKLAVRWIGQALHYLTFQRFLVGYSTLVLARKLDNECQQQ
jgi:SAM-dependent methyltransferase